MKRAAPPSASIGPVRVARRSRESTVTVSLRAARREVPQIEVTLPEPMVAHLIETFAAWARLDLRLRASGDLDHHIVEDAALVLGRAIRTALGATPRLRAGDALVPMDDALVQVALDLANRPHCAIAGELPPLVDHFLRSLATEAGWTLHVRVLAGHDAHHVSEAAMKALALALRTAAQPARAHRSRKGAPQWSVEPGW